jgi:hypothetical protein
MKGQRGEDEKEEDDGQVGRRMAKRREERNHKRGRGGQRKWFAGWNQYASAIILLLFCYIRSRAIRRDSKPVNMYWCYLIFS